MVHLFVPKAALGEFPPRVGHRDSGDLGAGAAPTAGGLGGKAAPRRSAGPRPQPWCGRSGPAPEAVLGKQRCPCAGSRAGPGAC